MSVIEIGIAMILIIQVVQIVYLSAIWNRSVDLDRWRRTW